MLDGLTGEAGVWLYTGMERFGRGHPVLGTRLLWAAGEAVSRTGHTRLLCRRSFVLPDRIRSRIWVSASQRYTLYLDGERLGRGPSRSDPDRWGVRAYDLDLEVGEHVLAALVTHRGRNAGKGQLGGPGFWLLAAENPDLEAEIGMSAGWVSHDHAGWEALRGRSGRSRGHFAVGDGEVFEGAGYPWGWEGPGFDDRGWKPMEPVSAILENPWGNRIGDGHFRPDPLPEMRETRLELPEGLLRLPLNLGAHADHEFVLDMGHPVNAYILLEVDGGAGSEVEWTSCEAPVDPQSGEKGNRDEWQGKAFPGLVDRFLPGGLDGERFETAWFRSFRYLRIRVRTANAPLCLRRLEFRQTGFPLEKRAIYRAEGSGRAWNRLLEATHRTAILCAHETTFDCPHYEQGQFAGDSRIQAIYHYLVGNDDRLVRKCIDDLAASRIWLGILRSHYPASFHQIIPTFSLYWIGMLDDFRIWRGDGAFLRPYLPLAREILQWFEGFIREDGLPGHIPFAPFIDWAFECGNAPQDEDGGSAILALLLARAGNWMSRLERFCGYPELAPRWEDLGARLRAAVRENGLGKESGLVADTASRKAYSVHGQTEAVLAGLFGAGRGTANLRKALADPGIRQPSSFYYRYYVGMALLDCGIGEAVHTLLEPWFQVLQGTGLKTLPENVSRPRSDCHAWSVFSGIAPFTHILGLRPDPEGAGMERMLWCPHPGPETFLEGTLPTPMGPIEVRLERSVTDLNGWIRSPVPVQVLEPSTLLAPGEHNLEFAIGSQA